MKKHYKSKRPGACCTWAFRCQGGSLQRSDSASRGQGFLAVRLAPVLAPFNCLAKCFFAATRYLDAVLFENMHAFLAFRVAYLQHAEDKRDQANCCARHIGGACSCCRCGFGCHALSQRARGDARHKGHDKRRAQTAGNLAAGVGDCVAMGDFVIGKRIDAPCVYGHVRERLPHGLSRAKHGYEHDG